MRKAIAAFALLYLAAHLPLLPPTLEDVDSINFALGVADFDVAKHQPHPPGYPVFVALGKASTAVLRASGVRAPEARGLAIWSAVCGALLIPLLYTLFRTVEAATPAGGSDARAFCAAAIAALSALCWFTALRPLSDMTGFAAAVAAQALLAASIVRGPSAGTLIAGAFIAGLAAGIRSQTCFLTIPLLALALVVPRGGDLRRRLAAVAAAAAGAALWALPLVVASGGLSAYAAALGSQAGEDFSGVVMLWTARNARVAAAALVNSFLAPWAHLAIGASVVTLAALGLVRAAWRMPRTIALLTVAFAPYAVFHLLFQETATVRYALPLIAPVAYLVTCALDVRPAVLRAGAAVLVAASLVVAVPASVAYGRDGSPAFRAFRDLESGGPPNTIAMHAVVRRAAEWEGDRLQRLTPRVLKPAHGHEWLALIDEWRANPVSAVSFIADPRRTDLALLDPLSRRLVRTYRWGFSEPPFVGGARPGNVEWLTMPPPGWMLDRGWAVTAEVAGVTARDGSGPHRAPSVAWVRTRHAEALMLVGGRNLGDAGGASARVTVHVNGRPFDAFEIKPGFFFRLIPLPAAALVADQAYVPVAFRSQAADGSSREIPVALEQFDVQSAGIPMMGVDEGWNEPEYNPTTARSWRWATERATLWVRPIGRDVTVTLSGESPLRYFDAAPAVTVSAGSRQIARVTPAADFTQSIVLPAEALAQADGRVVIQSDRWFVPAERDGTADRRHLALRIYSYSVATKDSSAPGR